MSIWPKLGVVHTNSQRISILYFQNLFFRVVLEYKISVRSPPIQGVGLFPNLAEPGAEPFLSLCHLFLLVFICFRQV